MNDGSIYSLFPTELGILDWENKIAFFSRQSDKNVCAVIRIPYNLQIDCAIGIYKFR